MRLCKVNPLCKYLWCKLYYLLCWFCAGICSLVTRNVISVKYNSEWYHQKQDLIVVFCKGCTEKFGEIYRKTLASESLETKLMFAVCNVIKKDFGTVVFQWILRSFFRAFSDQLHLCCWFLKSLYHASVVEWGATYWVTKYLFKFNNKVLEQRPWTWTWV